MPAELKFLWKKIATYLLFDSDEKKKNRKKSQINEQRIISIFIKGTMKLRMGFY